MVARGSEVCRVMGSTGIDARRSSENADSSASASDLVAEGPRARGVSADAVGHSTRCDRSIGTVRQELFRIIANRTEGVP